MTVDGQRPAGASDQMCAHDIAAEQCVLGGMMLDRAAILDVIDAMRPSDHYRPAHQVTHEAILTLFNAGEPSDPVSVAAELAKRGELRNGLDGPYLHTCLAAIPAGVNAAHYARIVHDHAILRRAELHGHRTIQLARSPGQVGDIIAQIQDGAYALTGDDDRTPYRPLMDVMAAAVDEVEALTATGGKIRGVPTGFHDLDELTNGLHPGQLALIAARPATGKSCLVTDICRAASIRHGHTSLMLSLEMSSLELGMRVLAAEARIPLHALRGGKISDPTDWQRIAGTVMRVQNAPMFILDTPDLTLMQIRALAQQVQQRHGLDLVVIDYLQLMQHAITGRRHDRREVVDEISRGLKILAKTLHIPIVAVAQLNRGPEQRADKRPLLSDLRESGSLEQDADLVILLHRDDVYERESPRAGEADLIVAKHRNGPTATVTVAFQGHYSRFVDLAPG